MPRRGFIPRRESIADPKFDSVLVTRFINAIMSDEPSARSVAEGHFYKAMAYMKSGREADGSQAGDEQRETGPGSEVARRVGGANQVPVEMRPDRQNALATRWIIITARGRADHSFAREVRLEILAASRNEGGAVKKREDTQDGRKPSKAFALPLVIRL